MTDYEAIIGLEVHAQLLTDSKIFCSCPTNFGQRPNQNTCQVCLGLPGALPVLNEKAVELAVRLGLALDSKINPVSYFERKHYFYPDLPGGYQTTQNLSPIVLGGEVKINLDNENKSIRLHHAHLEEDAGKLIHEPQNTLVDYNRSGQGLLEIVSEPEIKSAEEAVAYLKALRAILVYLKVSDGNLEEGSLRCDVNISLRPKGSKQLGVRSEIKNVNSFKSVARAINYEIRRHTAALENNEPLKRETRLFNEHDGSTSPMREKESAEDYRYLPDPNLGPVVVDTAYIEKVKQTLPELPEAKKQRYKEQLKLPEQDIDVLTQEPQLAAYFEDVVSLLPEKSHLKLVKTAANWILSELLRELSQASIKAEQSPIKAAQLAKLIVFLNEGKLSGPMAKEVFAKMFESGDEPEHIMERDNLVLVCDENALEAQIDEIIKNNQEQFEQLKAGNDRLMGYFIGQLMKVSQGKADPKKAGDILKSKL